MKKLSSLAVSLVIVSLAVAQNLLVNPSAESGDPTAGGWTNASMGSTGASCYNNSGWRILGNQNGFPAAEQGSYFFYAGCSPATGSTFEVRQDVNVSLNAVLIDAGWDAFTFSGYMQVYTQTPADQAEFIVEYRDVTNLIVLASYSSGFTSNQGAWTFYSNTKTAPVGTRVIRVRLLSKLNTGPSIDGYFDNLSLVSNIPLALTFSSFSVTPTKTDVDIAWSTSNQQNGNHFSVERSQDALDWEFLGKVTGQNNAGRNFAYTYIDINPPEGTLYYRIKQTDAGGDSTFSDIRETRFEGNPGIVIFPNPAKNMLTIAGLDVNRVSLSFFNSLGQMIDPPHRIQNNQVIVSVSGLKAGIYFVRLNDLDKSVVRKILIE